MPMSTHAIVAFLATTDSERAKSFYRDVLQLRLVEDTPFALVFDANGTTLRIQKVESMRPTPYTALGFAVSSIATEVQSLAAHGATFERYPGMDQDALGIWHVPGTEAKVAWFKDPDGNLLSLSESA